MTPLNARQVGATIAWLLALAILAFALWPAGRMLLERPDSIRPHLPDWALWAALPFTVQLHIVAALTALAIGVVILALPKGVGPHKALGWSWVAAMATTAVSSLFITGLNGNFYSLIHIISGWVIVALPLAIWAIRRRNVNAHRRAMTGMFVGGLLVAGALTFLPGRFMFAFLLG